MKITVVIDTEREEEIVVYSHGDTSVYERLCDTFRNDLPLVGYRGEEMRVLDVDAVYCFFTEGGHTYALTGSGRYLVKEALYKLEEQMGARFVRINQSCIAAQRAIEGFSASIGGSLSVRIKGGYTDYVSRRQLKTVKERFGIK